MTGAHWFRPFGIVTVRALGASAHQAGAIAAKLGPPCSLAVDTVADITIRFVPQVATRRLSHLEKDRLAYDDDGLLILWDGKRPITARLSVAEIGSQCEVVCDARVRTPPLLELIVRATALAKGYTTVHASAFELAGAGVLVAAAAHGGKTSAAIAHAGSAAILSDDTVAIDPAAAEMYGLLTPIELQTWQRAQLPELSSGTFPPIALSRALPQRLRARLRTHIRPEALFAGTREKTGGPDVVFLSGVSSDPGIYATEIPASQAVTALAHAFRRELLPLLNVYYASRCAFPHVANGLLDRAGDLNADLLRTALRYARAIRLQHPKPVELAQLAAGMRPHIAEPGARLQAAHTGVS